MKRANKSFAELSVQLNDLQEEELENAYKIYDSHLLVEEKEDFEAETKTLTLQCRHCGEIFETPGQTGWYRNRKKYNCPNCGALADFGSDKVSFAKVHTKDYDGGKILALIIYAFTMGEMVEDDNFEVISSDISWVSADGTECVYYIDGVITNSSNPATRMLRRYRDNGRTLVTDYCSYWDLQAKIQACSGWFKKKITSTKTALLKDELLSLAESEKPSVKELEDARNELIRKSRKMYPFYISKSVRHLAFDNMDEHVFECSGCGAEFKKVSAHYYVNEKLECPNCHLELNHHDIDVRDFIYIKSLKENVCAGYCVSKTSIDNIFVFNDKKTLARKGTRNIEWYSFSYVESVPETMKYWPFEEVNNWRLSGNVPYGISAFALIKKMQLSKLFEQIIKNGDVRLLELPDNALDKKAGNIPDLLGIPAAVYKKEKGSLDYREVSVWQEYSSLVERFGYDAVSEFKRRRIVASKLENAVSLIDVNLVDLNTYLNRCEANQCVDYFTAFDIWYDYIYYASKIEMDLSDRHDKYPASLKREHDRVIAKSRIINDSENSEAFIERCTKAQKKFGYKDDNYFLKAPESLQELFEEGRRLSHCVGSYANKIANGESTILFLRKASEPDKPYFTVEVINDKFSCAHGFDNKTTSGEPTELAAFLKEWKTEKRIID